MLFVSAGRESRQSVGRRKNICVHLIAYHFSITQHNIARRIVGYIRVVCHKDNGAPLSMQFLKEHQLQFTILRLPTVSFVGV